MITPVAPTRVDASPPQVRHRVDHESGTQGGGARRLEEKDTTDCERGTPCLALPCRSPLASNTVIQLPDVPFRLFAACAKDGYRKPMPGMWYELERIFKEHHVDIGTWPCRILAAWKLKKTGYLGTDRKAAFFVGDAAGRADDFASTDRKWAINIGLPFHTPEVSPYLWRPLAFIRHLGS